MLSQAGIAIFVMITMSCVRTHTVMIESSELRRHVAELQSDGRAQVNAIVHHAVCSKTATTETVSLEDELQGEGGIFQVSELVTGCYAAGPIRMAPIRPACLAERMPEVLLLRRTYTTRSTKDAIISTVL